MRFNLPKICGLMRCWPWLSCSAAGARVGPQTYKVDRFSTGDGAMDATLRATSDLITLRTSAPVSPYGLIARRAQRHRPAQDGARELRLLRVEGHDPDRRHGPRRSRPRGPSDGFAEEARRPTCRSASSSGRSITCARSRIDGELPPIGAEALHAEDRRAGGGRHRARRRRPPAGRAPRSRVMPSPRSILRSPTRTRRSPCST